MKVVQVYHSSEGYPYLAGAEKPLSHTTVTRTGGGGAEYGLKAEQAAQVAAADVVVETWSDGSGSVSVRQPDGRLIETAVKASRAYGSRFTLARGDASPR